LKLPRDLSGYDAVKIFKKEGWVFVRQRGSHMILTKPHMDVTLSVPAHNVLGPGLLKSLIKDSGLTIEEFLNLR
jgi:predicted RNA binding protein YcfA (HicA-like mRNA interferase family)